MSLFGVTFQYHNHAPLLVQLGSNCTHSVYSENNNNVTQVAPVPVPTNPSPQPPIVTSGVVLAAAPTNLIDISDTGDQEKVKSRKTKNYEKALLLSDDEF